MSSQRPPRPLSVLASALATGGIALAVAGCSNVTPLGPDPSPLSLPPVRDLGSPIIVQVMRSQDPTPAGTCPAGSVALFGSDPYVPRATVGSAVAGPPQPVPAQLPGSTATPTPTTTPPTPTAHPTPTAPAAPPVGVACFRPVGRPVTITSAAVTSVATYPPLPPPPGAPKGPVTYGFIVAFPTADVAAVTAVSRQAAESGDATGITVAGKLWQAPQIQRELVAFRGMRISLLSRKQAFQLHHLLVPSG